eukprot:TRINITY_DN2145_c0_g1_i1.p1 TRINITY_DN2145_c0_g1~~TRINITY_DN2145_c0_g1_i1.p1  ORF type:complete len:119 (+),score=7.50 TRINITY_DN2145_c0_g1_i1:703-1059(+)
MRGRPRLALKFGKKYFRDLCMAMATREEAFLKRSEAFIDPRTPEATPQEMEDAQLPLATRDACAHLLIRLNRCRFETYYLPWKCSAKREAYMRCLGQEYDRRVLEQEKLKLANMQKKH